MPAPSLRTKPSRSLSNGRLARLRVVVAQRQGAGGDEAAQAHRRDGRLGAAGDHDVGVVALDGAQGVADGVGGRGAGGGDGGVRAAQAELDRDVAGRRVGDHLRDDERADPAGPALDEAAVLLLELVQAADAAADDDAAADRDLPWRSRGRCP